ncbi:S8 family serine peptidase [Paenibacillus aurantiacus]|uniref:S8 family serine peptidase n=1 Tax=Paenibacillus aurantiacus TaxID=1936118 RepID=A0ABV5KR81_9BACL
MRTIPVLNKVVSLPLAALLAFGGAMPLAASAQTAPGQTAPTVLSSDGLIDRSLLAPLPSSHLRPAYVSPNLKSRQDEPVRVILTLSQQPGAVGKYAAKMGVKSMTQQSAERAVRQEQTALIGKAEAEGLDVQVNYQYDTVLNGMEVTVPGDQIDELAELPGVTGVFENLNYYNLPDQAGGTADEPFIDYEPLKQIGVLDAWEAGLSGKGLKVGVIDTGVDYTHPDLKDAYVGGYNAHTHTNDPYENIPGKPEDKQYGTDHGTHVAGTIVGQAKNATSDIQQKGIAYGAKLYAYKVLASTDEPDRASGSSAQVIDGIERAVEDGMDVINLSLGSDVDKDPNSPDAIAVNNAVLAGVVTVVASGNAADSGPYYYSMGSPATSQLAIAVGAATTVSKRFEASVTVGIAKAGVKPEGAPSGEDATVEPADGGAAEQPATARPDAAHSDVQQPAAEKPEIALAVPDAEDATASSPTEQPASSAAEEPVPPIGGAPIGEGSPIGLMAWKTSQEDFASILGSEPLEGVYVGLGADADYEGKDVLGKVVFISRGTLTFVDKIAKAKAHGAKAAVIFNGNAKGSVPDLSESIPGRDEPIGALGFLGDSPEYIPTFDMAGTAGRALAKLLTEQPGTYPTFTFGSTFTSTTVAGDTMASFSSRGPNGDPDLGIKPDIVAPGVGILSTVPAYGKGNPEAVYDEESYGRKNGTSMATPHVAGLALLLQEAHPDWTPFDIRAALANTADLIKDEESTLYDVYSQGAGRVNVAKAIKTPALLQTVEHLTLLDTNLEEKDVVNYGSSASFGLVKAGADAKSVKLVLKNFSNADLTYTASIVKHASVTGDPNGAVATPDGANIDVQLEGTDEGALTVAKSGGANAPGQKEFTLTLSPQADAADGVYEGEVVLRSEGQPDLHLPYVVHVGDEKPGNGFGVQDVLPTPRIITPDGDGKDDTTDVSYTLTAEDVNYIELQAYDLNDELIGVFAAVQQRDENGELVALKPGARVFEDIGDTYIGDADGDGALDLDDKGQPILHHLKKGTYRLVVDALSITPDNKLGAEYLGFSEFRVADTSELNLRNVAVTPDTITPDGDGKDDTTDVSFDLKATDVNYIELQARDDKDKLIGVLAAKQERDEEGKLLNIKPGSIRFEDIDGTYEGDADGDGKLDVDKDGKPIRHKLKVGTYKLVIEATGILPDNTIGSTYTASATLKIAEKPVTPPPSGGGGGGGYVPPVTTVTPPAPAALDASANAVVAQGQQQVRLTAAEEKKDGASLATVKDEDLEAAIKQAGSSPAAIIVQLQAEKGQRAQLTLTAKQTAILASAPSGSTLLLSSGGSSLALPLSLVKGLSAESGLQLILAPQKDKAAQFGSAEAGLTVIGDPVAFEVNVTDASGSKPLAVPFSTLVKRSFTIPGSVKPNSAGVLYEEGGKLRPAASTLAPQDNGTTVVTVSRPGFSTYAAVSSAVQFGDIAGSWAEPKIQALAAKLLVNGTDKTTFSPKRAVTRAEFASLLARALGLSGSSKQAFPDVPKDAWYAQDVAAAYEAGLITGTPEGRFAPDASITRDQLSVMLARAIKLLSIAPAQGAPSRVAYGDESQFPGYAKDSIAAVTDAGILRGDTSGDVAYFRGQTVVTRDVASVAILQLLQQGKLTD